MPAGTNSVVRQVVERSTQLFSACHDLMALNESSNGFTDSECYAAGLTLGPIGGKAYVLVNTLHAAVT